MINLKITTILYFGKAVCKIFIYLTTFVRNNSTQQTHFFPNIYDINVLDTFVLNFDFNV